MVQPTSRLKICSKSLTWKRRQYAISRIVQQHNIIKLDLQIFQIICYFKNSLLLNTWNVTNEYWVSITPNYDKISFRSRRSPATVVQACWSSFISHVDVASCILPILKWYWYGKSWNQSFINFYNYKEHSTFYLDERRAHVFARAELFKILARKTERDRRSPLLVRVRY